jgi:uridylate kinase
METILLKLSGELLSENADQLVQMTAQLKKLSATHRFAIVIGGGNFFRARTARQEFGLRQPVADAVGMLATAMNGLILQEYFNQHGLPSTLLSAVPLPSLAQPINQATIDAAHATGACIIFCGGTGNPYFTTDTTAIVRALQIGASQVWKATNVDYVYDGDPRTNKACKPLRQVSYAEILQKQLKIMDLTAITLAQQHVIKIRVFNIFTPNALEEVAHTPTFGSTIS